MHGRIVFIRREWLTVKIDDLPCVRARVEMGMMQLAWIKVSGRPSPPAGRPPALPSTGIDFVNLLGSSPVHPLLSPPPPSLPIASSYPHYALLRLLPFAFCPLNRPFPPFHFPRLTCRISKNPHLFPFLLIFFSFSIFVFVYVYIYRYG